MTTLPSAFPAGYEPTGDDMQAILDMVTALVNIPVPAATATNGTASSGTTETKDAVIGDFTFTVPAAGGAWRYQAFLTGAGMNTSIANDLYKVNIRDGGASSPTSSSTLIASTQILCPVVGGGGQSGLYVAQTFVPTVGVHTLGVFTVRANGTGAGTPVTPVGAMRELGVRFVGLN